MSEFAALLVKHVRDAAIREADISIQSAAKGPVAERWRAAGVVNAKEVIPDVVDDTIFVLLRSIDQGLIRLAWIAPDEKVEDLQSLGGEELAGYYIGDWRESLSNERCAKDLDEDGA